MKLGVWRVPKNGHDWSDGSPIWNSETWQPCSHFMLWGQVLGIDLRASWIHRFESMWEWALKSVSWEENLSDFKTKFSFTSAEKAATTLMWGGEACTISTWQSKRCISGSQDSSLLVFFLTSTIPISPLCALSFRQHQCVLKHFECVLSLICFYNQRFRARKALCAAPGTKTCFDNAG